MTTLTIEIINLCFEIRHVLHAHGMLPPSQDDATRIVKAVAMCLVHFAKHDEPEVLAALAEVD